LIKSTTKTFNSIFSLTLFAGAIALACSGSAISQDLILLTLDDDRIGEIEALADDISAEVLINSYYELLSDTKRFTLMKYEEQLDNLIVDYEVARTAADSAEITEVISDMDAAWIEIQKIHNEEFSLAVIEILNSAYGKIYPLL
jgi:hypothetical protein